jgi:hypothetical protein
MYGHSAGWHRCSSLAQLPQSRPPVETNRPIFAVSLGRERVMRGESASFATRPWPDHRPRDLPTSCFE